jgi:amidase
MTETIPEGIGERSLDITQRYWGWDELAGGESVQLLADWDAFRSHLLAFMEDFDVILCPASPDTAPLHGEDVRTMFRTTLPFSLTGQPCVAVPAGMTEQGLPVGVQVVARAWRDDVAFAVALRLGSALGGWRAPAL